METYKFPFEFDRDIPAGAMLIIRVLTEHGFEAYIVGGCVRDLLRGVEPKDWDICTSAHPDKVIEICIKEGLAYYETGLQHGTLTIVIRNVPYEVTTFRADVPSKDHRHPKEVKFVTSIEADLGRRDFTINSIAYDPINKIIIDPYGGIRDLNLPSGKTRNRPRPIIDTTGEIAHLRLREDALRILRALRFSVQIDGNISYRLMKAILDERFLLTFISNERICSEITKIITGEASSVETLLRRYMSVFCVFIPEFYPTIKFDQRSIYHKYTLDEHLIRTVGSLQNNKLHVRLAALLHDIGKVHCFQEELNGTRHFLGHADQSADIAENILTRLRFDNDTVNRTVTLIKEHEKRSTAEKKSIRRQLSRLHGDGELLSDLWDLQLADVEAQGTDLGDRFDKSVRLLVLEEILDDGVWDVSGLKVNGNDLMELGIEQGPIIGSILRDLLDSVMKEEIPNEHEVLMKQALVHWAKYHNFT